MILLDINPLVYAHREELTDHERYADRLAAIAEGTKPFALTSVVTAGFVRVVTNPRVFPDATPASDALRFVDELVHSPMCRLIEAGERWWPIFSSLCRAVGARGNLVPDAHLAALAIEYGCKLVTADRGFARFPDLRWRHPLEGS